MELSKEIVKNLLILKDHMDRDINKKCPICNTKELAFNNQDILVCLKCGYTILSDTH